MDKKISVASATVINNASFLFFFFLSLPVHFVIASAGRLQGKAANVINRNRSKVFSPQTFLSSLHKFSAGKINPSTLCDSSSNLDLTLRQRPTDFETEQVHEYHDDDDGLAALLRRLRKKCNRLIISFLLLEISVWVKAFNVYWLLRSLIRFFLSTSTFNSTTTPDEACWEQAF